MTYAIHGPETWPNDPREENDCPEIDTDFCSYCGAEVPTAELVLIIEDKCCSDCLVELKQYALDNNEEVITSDYKRKPYKR